MDVETCTASGCGRAVAANGLCAAHCRRLRFRGDLVAEIPIRAGAVLGAVNSSRNIALTALGREAAQAGRPLCELCHARHGGPREIGIVAQFLVVCYGAEYARDYLAQRVLERVS